jgi:hypothetical protein
MADLIVNSATTHSLLLILPIACALLLRWAHCPGWPVVGGVAAGLLLGPGLLGRAAPDWYESTFVGAVEERAAYEAILRDRERELAVMSAAGATMQTIDARVGEFEASLDEARARRRDAERTFQRPFRSFTATVTALSLLGGGLLGVRRRDRRQQWTSSLSIGIWSALLPGALAVVGMHFWWGAMRSETALVAAAVAIGPWILTAIDREAADRAEFGGAWMIERAGRIASIIAIVVTTWAVADALGAVGLIWVAPLLAMPLGWLLPAPRGSIRRIAAASLSIAFVPMLAACAAMRIDLFEHASLWPMLFFILLSGDARWLAAFLGAMLPGARRSLRTMRLVLGSMACGPTQLALIALAAHLSLIPGTFAIALIAGAVVIEVTVPARRSMSRRLSETEQDLESMDDGS